MVTGLAYASMVSCHEDLQAANGKIADVPGEAEITTVDVPKMDDLALLFKKTPAGPKMSVPSIC